MKIWGADYWNYEGEELTEYFTTRREAVAAVNNHNTINARRADEEFNDERHDGMMWEPAKIHPHSTTVLVNKANMLRYFYSAEICNCRDGSDSIYNGPLDSSRYWEKGE